MLVDNSIYMADSGGDNSRLVLGTAQLGMEYGIANKSGKPDFASALSIVEAAWDRGIGEFDTAQAYGDSEMILGQIFAELGIMQKAKVTTKLKSVQIAGGYATIHRFVEQSLERLKVSMIQCLLLHREDMLDMLDDGLKESLLKLVHKGYVRYLGVSVYSPERAKQALGYDCFHAIQIPANIIDRRFERAGVFDVAQEKNRQIYIRSAFLQGLLLMNVADVPKKMASIKPILQKLDHLAMLYQLSRQAIAMLYLRDRFPSAKVIFGAEIREQVTQNTDFWKLKTPKSFLSTLENAFEEIDEDILNPAKWHHL